MKRKHSPQDDDETVGMEREEQEPAAKNKEDDDEDDDELTKKLRRLYQSPEEPGSYGGVEALYRRAKQLRLDECTREKLTHTFVQRFLSGEASYTLHRQVRKHFKRNPTYVSGIDEQWQADLVDMQALSRANKGVRYLLTCIDVFSKFAWAIPCKAKSATEMVTAFRQLFKEAHPRRPSRLQTDKGKEFLNSQVQTLLRDTYQIAHFYSWSDQKAAVVERFNRTLKSHMWRYFSAKQTNRYLDILPKLMQAYNNSYHRSIGTMPANVRTKDEPRIWQRLYGKHLPPTSSTGKSSRVGRATVGHPRRPGRAGGAARPARAEAAAAAAAASPTRDESSPTRSPPPRPPPSHDKDPLTQATDSRHRHQKAGENEQEKIEKGALVRITRGKGDFVKGYLPNWSEEDFRVRAVHDSGGKRRVYKLEDRSGEPIKGVFYREEIQKISKNRFLVERILRRRPIKNSTATGSTECLVKWRGWPAKFNTWVPLSELDKISGDADADGTAEGGELSDHVAEHQ